MKILVAILMVIIGFALPVHAMETREVIIKDHVFIPKTIIVPANTRVKLKVDNQDSTPAEFESDDFKREKILPGNSQATIFIPPLEVGEYKFFDEFNMDTTQGILKVE